MKKCSSSNLRHQSCIHRKHFHRRHERIEPMNFSRAMVLLVMAGG